MRSDFPKLLCERPRHGSRWSNDSEAHYKRAEQKILPYRDYDEWASGGKIGMKKHFSGKSRKEKSLNENLAPLLGFLIKACGRLWNDVFSEISKVCPNDSAVNAHIYQHLFQYVELNPVIDEKDGTVYKAHHRRYRYGVGDKTKDLLLSNGRSFQFYVDNAGFLRLAPQIGSAKKKIREKELEARKKCEVRVSNERWAVLLKGIWYWAWLSDIPELIKTKKSVTHSDGTVSEHDAWASPRLHDLYRQNPAYVLNKDAAYLDYVQVRDFSKVSPQDQWDTIKKTYFTSYYGVPKICLRLTQMNSVEISTYVRKSL